MRLPNGPCLGGQTCDENADRCVTNCAVARDADGDGADAMECGGTDCDDANAAYHPGATEVCDPAHADEDCDPSTFGVRDADGDGAPDARCCNGTGAAARCGTDCDDALPGVGPNASEVCNGRDDDCDTAIDEQVGVRLYPDLDMDGAGDARATPTEGCSATSGLVTNHDDCDDTCATCNPGAPEICDAKDNDCDTRVDEMTVPVPWYVDADGDGYGDPSMPTMLSCLPIAGYAVQGGDCDDAMALVHPFAMERCNAIDDDCSSGGGALPAEDADGDLHAPLGAACSTGYPLDDCDDASAGVHPGATELCDQLDEDCSTGGGAITTEDADGDMHAPTTGVCTGGPIPADDCDDTDPRVNPGLRDHCDGIDGDCSSGGGVALDEDGDGDHYAPTGATCRNGNPSDYPRTDCNDADASIHPGATEACNGVNDNCSGGADEGCPLDVSVAVPTTSFTIWTRSNCTTAAAATLCPSGTVMTQLVEQLNVTVPEGIRAGCSTLDVAAAGAVGTAYSYSVSVGPPTALARIGTVSSGTTLTCPAGTIATGIVSMGTQLECRPIGISGGPTASSYVLALGAPVLVGTAGTVSGGQADAHCPAGSALVSISAMTCTAPRVFEAQCGAVAVSP
ncbi:MAG: putative metal-binding motif-containing protein [Sandaracinus sp.]